ncbi:flagellar hook-length control protein FliK [Paenibacillus solani]|uniref:Flagellar hook-length control protein n=1 Tax=Paenibacillus solani TaxID=1705565 RepID=A0A0M1P6H2_9BACL|nr:flagellar hook-length control protein FliK [Paenibacillus solani]KOR90007.1 flagellar hook-length control protein [Paenibacillus solani]
MTMTVQNMTPSVSSSSASGKTSAAGQTVAGATFDSALAYQMNSGGSSTTIIPTEVAAKLVSMIAQQSTEIDESLDGLMELVQGILQELDTMDQALIEDPALLQEIQSWLAQANILLSEAVPQPQGDIIENEMPLLASSSETIRFVVQDTISQLASALSKSGQVDSNTEAAVKQLVQSFHTLLGQGATVGEGRADSKFSSMLNRQQPEVTQQSTGTTNAASQTAQTAPSETTGSANAKGTLLTATSIDSALPESGMNEGDALLGQGTVTAGQLALRSGTQVTVKPAAPPVPVENFSNEMTTFIINKMEIVKQTGFTEARISLNPEHLGQVDIKLTMQNGQLIAQFMTRSTDAKELIDQQMAHLRSALHAQGLQVERIEVTQSSQASNANLYQDGGRQPGSGQQQSQQRSKEKDRPSEDAILAANLTEELNDWIDEHQIDDEQVQAGTFTAKA